MIIPSNFQRKKRGKKSSKSAVECSKFVAIKHPRGDWRTRFHPDKTKKVGGRREEMQKTNGKKSQSKKRMATKRPYWTVKM